MFFRILKKDLKRKKTMNIILLIFVMMSTMFMASSVKNLVTILGAVNYFTEISEVPDFFMMALVYDNKDEIEDFLEKNQNVTAHQSSDLITVSNEQITIKSCAAEPGKTEYKKLSMLGIQSISEDFMKVFTQKDEPLELENGEIAIAKVEAEENDLQQGDRISIKIGEKEQEFTVKEIIKDAVFGSSMMGYKRMFVTEEDFAFFAAQSEIVITRLHGVNYGDADAFKTEFRKQQFDVITAQEKSIIKYCYIMDMLISGILIVVSVCLILIAFLILRFTIVFTLQEDYKEIGIMKALGLRNRSIKKLYLVKYFGIAVAGAVIGVIFSVPFGEMLLRQAMINIVSENAGGLYWVNGVCAAGVVGIVVLFCYGSTNGLKKFSAMEAIRNGSNGERFRAKSKIRLHDTKRMHTWLYLAVNDILSNFRRFAVLSAVFCIGTILILLPLSAVSTLQSKNLLYAFSIIPSDVYITGYNENLYVSQTGKKQLEQDLEEIKKRIEDAGEPCDVWAERTYLIPCYSDNPEEIYSYFTMQAVGDEQNDYRMLAGTQPVLENEIIVTEKTANEMGVEIGDYIYMKKGSGKNECSAFLVTGLFDSMLNMGDGFRVSQKTEFEAGMAEMFSLQINLKNKDAEEALDTVRKIMPEVELYGWERFLQKMMGDIVKQLNLLHLFIVGIVIMINCLITALMIKTLMTKERGEIAILKSVGFYSKTIKAWQTARILILLTISIVVGTLLSHILGPVAIGPIFGMMGASHIPLETDTLKTFLLYPACMLLATGMCAYFCAGEVRKVDVKEISNVE